MAIVINTNIAALDAQRNLSATSTAYGKSVEKLSSGLRINRAADDAAGLVISEKLRGQVSGLNQAARNAQDGISLTQTGDGALNEVQAMLQRIRELAVQRANGTVDADGQSAIDAEVSSLQNAITSIEAQTTFNGVALFSNTTIDFQVGANDGDKFTVQLTQLSAPPSATDALSTIDSAITAVSNQRATFGAAQNTLEHLVANLGVASENMSASESRIRDLDVAAEMVNFTKSQILQQAGVAVLAQANQAPQTVLSLLR